MIRSVAFAAGLSLAAAFASGIAAAEDDPLVARVDGVEIRQSDALLARGRLPAQYQQMPAELLMPILVNVVIDAKLVAAEARRSGLLDDPEVKDQLARLEELVLEQAMLARTIEAALTEDAIDARYRTLVEETEKAEEIRARHILVEHETEAKEVIASLADGADFAEVAKARSVGPSAQAGGDLGYFGRAEMVEPFADAAFALEVGAVTETPVKTQFGWHVIKLEDRRQAKAPPKADVADQLRGAIARDVRAAYVTKLREAAEIERFEPAPAEAPADAPAGAPDSGQPQ